MKRIYLFSGLGADRRVYQPIDFSGFEPVHIEWLAPDRNESIPHYVSRLRKQITTERPILIGVSFGGILAIEMSKIIDTEKTIILSSVKSHAEIPFVFRFLAPLRLHKLIPKHALTKPNSMIHHMFGCKKESSKKLLDAILRDSDPDFIQWGMDAIMAWRNTSLPKNLVHIHGTADRIFPYSAVTCNIAINKGSHFMIFDQADEITNIIRNIIINS